MTGTEATASPADGTRRWQTVSVVIVTFDGRDDLEACLDSLPTQSHPSAKLEVIVVDNASTDGTDELLAARADEITVISNDHNAGFAPAVNQGANAATGTYLALLNNDATADPNWLREAVAVLESSPEVACVASKILRDDRKTVDYAGGQLSFYGHGFAARNDELDDPADRRTRPTLFASGGAMVVRRDVYLDTGGFDDDFFAFFEDVDFGWRLWLLGHEVRYVPASVVYHRHHGTMARFGSARERYLLERNALMTLFKNYGEDLLGRALPGSVMLALLRGLATEGPGLPDFGIVRGAKPIEEVTLTGDAAASVAAVRDFGLALGDLRVKRAEIQSRRVVAESTVLRLFEEPVLPNHPDRDFLTTFHNVVATWDLDRATSAGGKVVIITADRIGKKMAGPAIRCWEMAKLLSREHEVVLATTTAATARHSDFAVMHVDHKRLDALVADADLVIFQGFVLYLYPQLADADAALLVDIYDPFHLEGLELRRHEPPGERIATARSDIEVLNRQLSRGDFFVCASDKQRDFWLGQLASLGRVNPATYDADASLRQLIDIAPFGLPADPPERTGKAIKGVVEGIDDDDLVMLWGGGVYDWFDPLTLIRGLAAVVDERPKLKLYFMGTAHPNPDVPAMSMAQRAAELADELGLLGTHVFFNDGWVDYERRADYLLDADIGVSTHFEHVETAFSFRTRVLDYIWASLPLICTEGDAMARLCRERDLGIVVDPQDVEGVAQAIADLHDDAERRARHRAAAAELAPELTWERAMAPIVAYARNPVRAPDRTTGAARGLISPDGGIAFGSPRWYAQRLVSIAREQGVRQAAARGTRLVRRKLRG